jgi:hypothetical protein
VAILDRESDLGRARAAASSPAPTAPIGWADTLLAPLERLGTAC